LITQAAKAKKNTTPADQLKYASQLLSKQQSGSAQVYAKGLAQASKEFKGRKQVTPNNAINLIQALMGGGQASTAQSQGGMGDLLGSLLGGGTTTQQPQSQQTQGGMGDLLGSLLGGGTTTQQPQSQQGSPGLDIGDLINAGMAYMNAKSQGKSTLEALINALVSGSAMSNSNYRSQSGATVVNALLQAIGGMTAK
jgi:hypothetical protein